MAPDVDESKLVTIYELLDMSEEDAERLTNELGQMVAECEGPAELCKQVVDKYGIEAVFTSICLRMILENLSLVKVDRNWMMQCPNKN